MPNSTPNPGTDRDTLIQKAYASDANLTIRIETHALYSEPKIDFPEWVCKRVMWRGDEKVLDVGMGAGLYFSPVLKRIPNGKYFAGDLSIGMALAAQNRIDAARIPITNLDVQALPFPDQTFDVVLANHMLYHVPDIDAALMEIQRVLKPEGVLVAATNGQLNLNEFDQLTWRAYGRLGVADPGAEIAPSITTRFALEDGASWLRRHFYAVVRHDLPGMLAFPEAKPVVDYLNSLRAIQEPTLPSRITWERYMEIMTEQVTRMIAHHGKLYINKMTGVLIATQRGDFIEEYVQRYEQTLGIDSPPEQTVVVVTEESVAQEELMSNEHPLVVTAENGTGAEETSVDQDSAHPVDPLPETDSVDLPGVDPVNHEPPTQDT
jgi:SAM-dependent methyltransferase